MSENEITHKVIECAFKIHRALGPGLLETAYEVCLFYELKKTGLYCERQRPIPLVYDEVKMDCGYRADLTVENKVVVEIKAVEAINPIFLTQTLTHLKLIDYRVGLLINFNVLDLKNGIRRVVNNYQDIPSNKS